MLWGLTAFAMIKAATNFSEVPKPDDIGAEGYNRLLTILSKNKYGYNTRFMSDFDLFLEALFNQRFIDESTLYYDDVTTEKEITDHEAGLNSDFAHADVRHMLKDRDGGHHENFKALCFPDRVGTNYVKSDALSCYKILPKGVKPVV
jgi:predicted component of viral defense system (DUF524 family)